MSGYPDEMPTEQTIEQAYESLWRRVSTAGDDDCWEWTGATNPKGYGCIGGKAWRAAGLSFAHRAVYVQMVGPIPEGFVVMHVCDNPPCCNPRHLRVGTIAENQADMKRKGRGVKYGGWCRSRRHWLDDDRGSDGGCVPCNREYQRRRYATRGVDDG